MRNVTGGRIGCGWVCVWIGILYYFTSPQFPASVNGTTIFPYITTLSPFTDCVHFYSAVYVPHTQQYWYSCRKYSNNHLEQEVIWATSLSVTTGTATPATLLMSTPECYPMLLTDPYSQLSWASCSNRLFTITPTNWTAPTPSVMNLTMTDEIQCLGSASGNPSKTVGGSIVYVICTGLHTFTNFTIFTVSNFTSAQPTLTVINYPQQPCHLVSSLGVVDIFGNLWIQCVDFSSLLMVDSGGRNSTLPLDGYCTWVGVQQIDYDETWDDLYVACAVGDIYIIHHPSNSSLRTFELVITADQCSGIGSISWDPMLRTLTASCVKQGVIVYRPYAVTTLVNVLNTFQCTPPGLALTQVFSLNGLVLASCATGVISVVPGTFLTSMGQQVCGFGSELIQDTNTGNLIQSCVIDDVSLAYIQGTDYIPFQYSDVCDVTLDVILDSRSGTMVVACLSQGIVIRYPNSTILPMIDFYSCSQFVSLEIDLSRQSVYVLCSGDGVYAIQYEVGTYSLLVDGSMCPIIDQVYLAPNSTDLWIACADLAAQDRLFSSFYKFDTIQQTYTTIFDNSSFCRPAALFGDPTIPNLFIYCDQYGTISFDPLTYQWNLLLPESACTQASLFHLGGGRLYYSCAKLIVQSFDVQFALTSPNLVVNNTQLSQTLCDSVTSVWVDPNTEAVFGDCTDQALSVTGLNYQCYPGSEWLAGDCSACTLGKYRNYSLIRSEMIECQTCPIGSVAPETGTMDCIICQPGTFAVSSVIACQPCPLGFFQDGFGATRCLPCPAGVFGAEFNLSTSSCSGPCLPGYWCGESSTSSTQLPCGSPSVYCPLNSSTPLLVSPGYYSDLPSIPDTVNTYTTQTPCPIGSECDGSGLSRLCVSGHYQNLTGQSLCTECEVGRYASEPGQTVCAACAPGSYTNSLGSIVCKLCSPGEYTSYNGSTSCQSCPSGHSASESGYPVCSECAPGRYTNDTHSIQCQPCPTGFKQSEYGATKCDPCPAGSYAFDFTSTECQLCQPGRYSDQPGSSTCLPCSQGSSSNETGRSSPCTLCPPGTFQSASASFECQPCQVKTYSAQPGALGQTGCSECSTVTNGNRSICFPNGCQSNTEYDLTTGDCRTCLLGQTSNAGFTCGSCPSNTYTPYLGSGCVSCTYPGMDGIQCAGGFPSIMNGYWAYQIETYVNEIPDHKILLFQSTKCPEGFCQGAELQPRITNTSVDSSIIISSFQPNQCSYPRVNDGSNILCGGCTDGYIPWSDSCVSCTRVNGGLVVLYLFVSFLLVLFLSRSSLGSSAGYSVVLLYFAQTAMLEVGPVRGWLAWIGIVNFNGTNGTTGCLAPWNQYEQTLVSLLIPLFLLAELIFIACIRRVLSTTRWNMRVRSISALPIGTSKLDRFLYYISSDFSWSRYIGASMSILLFCYTQTTSTCIRYLTCVSVGDSKVVFSAPTMDCRSDAYKEYLVPVILVLVIYVVGFPVGILAFLWSRRIKLADRAIIQAIQQQIKGIESDSTADVITNPSSTISSSSSPTPPLNGSVHPVAPIVSSSPSPESLGTTKANSMSVAFVSRWGPLFQMYSQEAWFWTCTVLIRRALFVILNVSLLGQPHARGMSFVFLNFLSLLLQLRFRPFTDEAINTVELLSHIILIIISTLLTAYIPPFSIALQVILFLLIVPTIAFLIFRLVHQKATSLQERFQSFRRAKSLQHQRMADEYEAEVTDKNVHEAVAHGRTVPRILPTSTMNEAEAPTNGLSHTSLNVELTSISISATHPRTISHPTHLLNPFVLTTNPLHQSVEEVNQESAAM